MYVCVVFKLSLVKHCKMSLPQKANSTTSFSMMSWKALSDVFYQWQEVENEVVNGNLIAIHLSLTSVMMTEFLIHCNVSETLSSSLMSETNELLSDYHLQLHGFS